MSEKLNVAVISGNHFYDVVEFDDAFAGMEGMRCYQIHMQNFVTLPKETREWFDVVAFYNFHNDTPDPETEAWYEAGFTQAMLELGETKQGLVILHHANVAWIDWPMWDDITGIENRAFTFHHDNFMSMKIIDKDHPITKGIDDYIIHDEGFIMPSADEGSGSHVLIKTDHPNCVKVVAWTRQYKNSPVFCFQSGHDKKAFNDKNWQEVLRRGILWAGGKLK